MNGETLQKGLTRVWFSAWVVVLMGCVGGCSSSNDGPKQDGGTQGQSAALQPDSGVANSVSGDNDSATSTAATAGDGVASDAGSSDSGLRDSSSDTTSNAGDDAGEPRSDSGPAIQSDASANASSTSETNVGSTTTSRDAGTGTNPTQTSVSFDSSNDEPFPDASIEPRCGDGTLDANEDCDDGNGASGDGCSASCTVETAFACDGEPSVCSDIDECATVPAPCGANAVCTNRVGGFDCSCEPGFENQGDTCVDVNECELGTGSCHVDAVCNNTPGGFTCSCKPGFSGDGTACENIDECEADESPCGPDAVCVDTAGSYLCTCEDGFEQTDGGACTNVDECEMGVHTCDVNATCNDGDGGYTCTCNEGFIGDGETCTAAPAGTLTVAPESLEVTSSAQSVVKERLTLANDSDVTIEFSMNTSAPWLSVFPVSGTVEPHGVLVLDVTAERGSLALGVYTGNVEVTHSAASPVSPRLIPVTFNVNYRPTSPYLLNPELGIEFVKEVAEFRYKARDNVNGGVHTHVDRQGNPLGINEKSMCGQSRAAYAFVRAFMLTGEERYLEHAHHALKFLYDHAYNNGWYFVTNNAGNYVPHWGHNEWWSFQQHYALVGITAMVEATGGNLDWGDGSQSDEFWLNRGVNSNYTRLWDNNSATAGYFEYASNNWQVRRGKGFTPTVDAVTTHAELLALMTDEPTHHTRLYELADNIMDHMVGNMSNAAAGFPEIFNSNWGVDNNQPNAEVGHLYKTAWVLARIHLMDRSRTAYGEAAKDIMWDLWNSGAYDKEYGGPYSTINWRTGAIVNSNKNQWMLEQGLTSGLTTYQVATERVDRNMFLEVADGSLNFYMNYLVDPVYGETYADVSADGGTVVDPTKGGLFTAGYHASEVGYYVYMYGNLYYHRKPVTLYYKYPPAVAAQDIRLNPIPLDADVEITAVELDGEPYNNFTGPGRTLHLAAGTGGVFKVTFGVVD